MHQPVPPAEGLVLEIGAGQSPHPRADVVVDKYLFDDFERPNEASFSFAKPVIVADGEALPFADRTFAYCLCLHVLEHAVSPGAFAHEIARVASAGFVQVPTRLAELTFGWPYHPWLIDKTGDGLIFEPKNGRHAPCGEVFHGLFAEDRLTRTWFNAHRSLFHHSTEWRSELRVKVTGSPEVAATAQVDVVKTRSMLVALSNAGALRPLPLQVREALRCPRCRNRLADEPSGDLACATCACRFPVVGGVPILVVEAAS